MRQKKQTSEMIPNIKFQKNIPSDTNAQDKKMDAKKKFPSNYSFPIANKLFQTPYLTSFRYQFPNNHYIGKNYRIFIR